MERLTRRGLMCFEEHPNTLPSPPGLQKCQVLKSTPAFPTNRRKKRGHLCFIGVLTVQRTRSALENTIQIYSGEVISVSQRCSPPPLWFLCHLSLCYMCVSGPLFPILFSFLSYSCIIFSYLAPCCLPPLPPARCFYSEALTQKKRELMNHLQLF